MGESDPIEQDCNDPKVESEDRYLVRVDNVFEGPLDLLVHLIKKAEVDIYDIPIADITDQYIAYLEWLKMMNIDLAGDFILMASTLTHIKSRMLLPVNDNDPEEEDPRLEITRPLLAYMKIKEAADALAKKDLLGESTFTRTRESSYDDKAMEADHEIRIGLFELIDAFQNILSKTTGDHRVNLLSHRVSVQERILELSGLLEKKGSMVFHELFNSNPERGEVVITFLALLEMAKRSLIRIAQHVQSGIIRIFFMDSSHL